MISKIKPSDTFRYFQQFCLLLLSLLFSTLACAVSVTYPRAESDSDSRYQYDWEVLRTALKKTSARFGAFDIKQSQLQMPPARVSFEMLRPNSEINLFVRATNAELETTFLPIRIPVDRGLLGYRIFLIRAADQERFAAIKSLDELRQFKVGQGRGWADVAILTAANFTVIEGSSYEGLFPMLKLQRFDFLSRSLDEAWREYDERHVENNLLVEPSILLYYPLPRYFFVRRDAEGELMAKRIEAGMEIMIKDGSLNSLFNKHKSGLIKRAGLAQRRIFRIPNPKLSAQTPLSRSELWYDPVKGK
ncbi:hypothetical protein [Undibacterium sp. Ren11W]|uniref:hypothetical protein n=1 Tax=Undibacterium sp. Ren11W TaxID=3413045 RepID=UPI003BF09B5F